MTSINEINEKLMEIHTHIINKDYDHLEENIEIAGINPKLDNHILNKLKQKLTGYTIVIIWLRHMYANHIREINPIPSSYSNR